MLQTAVLNVLLEGQCNCSDSLQRYQCTMVMSKDG